MPKRALFVGRFQPFHLGHLESVRYILREFDEVVVVVAAAQFSFTPDNPFTAGERLEMIREGLGDFYSRAYIVPVDNVPSNFEWPRHVLNYAPAAGVVFSNNPFVRLLFESYGLEARETPLVEGVSGTSVRRAMAEGGDWRRMVPAGTAEVIERIRGVERVRALWRSGVRMAGERLGG